MRKLMTAIITTLVALALSACTAPETPEKPETSEMPVPPVSQTTASSDILDAQSELQPETSAPPMVKAEYVKLSPQEAQEMMSGNAELLILDVRTQEEYDVGHIRNAVLLPDYEVAERAESVLLDKEQTILVYCRTGRRSELASRALLELGYTRVYDFGGIVDWTGDIITQEYDTEHQN